MLVYIVNGKHNKRLSLKQKYFPELQHTVHKVDCNIRLSNDMHTVLSLGAKFSIMPPTSLRGNKHKIQNIIPNSNADIANIDGSMPQYKKDIVCFADQINKTIHDKKEEYYDPIMGRKIRKLAVIHKAIKQVVTSELPHIIRHHRIVEADKNLGTVVISKHRYSTLEDNILSTDSFDKVVATTTPQDIYLDYANLLKKHKCDIVLPTIKEEKIPPLALLIKIHKHPIKGRPIVCSKNIFSTKLNKAITQALKIVSTRLKEMYPDFYWVVDNSTQVQQKIAHIPSARVDQNNIDSYDFTSMYTNIPLELLLQRINIVIELVGLTFFELQIPKINKAKTLHHEKWKLSTDTLLTLIGVLVRYTYFTSSKGDIYHQTKGIPMGGNSSPELANLFCCSYEIPYLIANRDMQIALKFCCRYIDDLLIPGTALIHNRDIACDVYQNVLELLKSERDNNGHVIMLDLCIMTKEKKYITKMFRKPNNAYAYPHAHSFIPESIRKGFIIGETLRIIRNNQHTIDCQYDFDLFVQRLKMRGYSPHYICNTIDVYIKKQSNALTIDATGNIGRPKDPDEDKITVRLHLRSYNPALRLQPIERLLKSACGCKVLIGWKRTYKLCNLIQQFNKN